MSPLLAFPSAENANTSEAGAGTEGHTGRNAPEIDDERLAVIVAAWPDLPEPIRRAMRAMVQ